MHGFKVALLSLCLVLSINGFAQDKESEKPKDPSWDITNDEAVAKKLMQGKRAEVQDQLAGYGKRLKDVHSYADRLEAKVSHLSLDLNVNFDKKEISGTAKFNVIQEKGERVIFDVKDLDIKKVSVQGVGVVNPVYGKDDPILGKSMEIPVLTKDAVVIIEYATKPTSDALQWLNKNQAGSALPFLYSQGEAILTRTWIPIQDSPGIKMTYDAKVSVPAGFKVAMSGKKVGESESTFSFSQEIPIPAYLIAIAVGEIEFRELSENCGIYALPEMIEKAAYEFAETPDMIKVAEEIAGPYVWGRYDMIVLPKAFPFGGMENPMLTFLTPTVITGDRSLVSLVAHELAHSWSGNLVTNATWNDFWLNEGITVYLERRIIEELRDPEFASMHRYNGYMDLVGTQGELGETSADMCLKLDLHGRNPDDGMTDVAYEKGALLLEDIESVIGREVMDSLLKSYFEAFKYLTITTEEFLYFIEPVMAKHGIEPTRVDAWVYNPELPTKVELPKKFRAVDETIQILSTEGTRSVDKKSVLTMSVPEWLYFLEELRTVEVDEQFLTRMAGNENILNNSELATKWFILALEKGRDDILPTVYSFLETVGRRKFLVPLYRTLLKTQDNIQVKKRYLEYSKNYHSVSVATLDKMIGVTEKERFEVNSSIKN